MRMSGVDPSRPASSGVTRRTVFQPRFTLAAMLVLITVIAIPLAYVAQRRSWNLRRKAAWEELNRKGMNLGRRAASQSESAKSGIWDWVLAQEPTISVRGIYFHCEFNGVPRQERFANSDLQLLRYFPEIETISLWGPGEISDQGMTVVQHLPKLETLELYSLAEIKGEFLWQLNATCSLKTLALHDLAQLEARNLGNLEKLRHLCSLELDDCRLLTDKTLQDVNPPSKLDDLNVKGSIGDATISRWLATNKLRLLTLQGIGSRNLVASMKSQDQLELLHITSAPLVDEDFSFLRNCNELVVLQLESMPIRGEFLDWLPNPKEMRKLLFENTLFEDANIAKLARFTDLNELNLSFTPITGEGFAQLPTIPKHWSIVLKGTQFSVEGKAALASRFRVDSESIFLPSNWTVDDMQLFAVTPQGNQVYLPDRAARDYRERFGRLAHGVYMPHWRGEETLKLLENCPVDVMTPVVRLHEIARRDWEALQAVIEAKKEENE